MLKSGVAAASLANALAVCWLGSAAVGGANLHGAEIGPMFAVLTFFPLVNIAALGSRLSDSRKSSLYIKAYSVLNLLFALSSFPDAFGDHLLVGVFVATPLVTSMALWPWKP